MNKTHNFRAFVFCPRCFYDVEEGEGYLEWKYWKFCPYCGSELVNVPVENRQEEFNEYKKSKSYIFKKDIEKTWKRVKDETKTTS